MDKPLAYFLHDIKLTGNEIRTSKVNDIHPDQPIQLGTGAWTWDVHIEHFETE